MRERGIHENKGKRAELQSGAGAAGGKAYQAPAARHIVSDIIKTAVPAGTVGRSFYLGKIVHGAA